MEQNQLVKYLGQDYVKAIRSIQVKQGTTKEGSIYYYLSLLFINGYEYRMFLKSDQQFAVSNAFELLNTQKSVDSF